MVKNHFNGKKPLDGKKKHLMVKNHFDGKKNT